MRNQRNLTKALTSAAATLILIALITTLLYDIPKVKHKHVIAVAINTQHHQHTQATNHTSEEGGLDVWVTHLCPHYKVIRRDERSTYLKPTQATLPQDAIFFIQTSCHTALTRREACAVESAAHHHPHRPVFVFMTYPSINHTHPLIQVLSRLSNVRLAWLNLDQVFADEPLRTWHRERLWMMNENRMSTVVSDAARVELLRRYGGTYLDLDALTLRPLPNTTNYLARIHDRLVSNAIISVTSGHPLMKMVADNIPSVFDATSCCSIGPELITRQLHRLCPDNVTIPASVGPNETETCGDVIIWPSKMFIPIHYGYLRHQLQSMFREGEGLGPTFIRNTEAFSLHLFNSVSHRRSVSLDEDSILKEVAIRNCPRIVELLRKYRTHL